MIMMNTFQVKNKAGQILRRLFSEIPGLRIAVFFNEDYSSPKEGYSMSYMDFSTDQDQLATFIEDVSDLRIIICHLFGFTSNINRSKLLPSFYCYNN